MESKCPSLAMKEVMEHRLNLFGSEPRSSQVTFAKCAFSVCPAQSPKDCVVDRGET
jgi:hypothetical protein